MIWRTIVITAAVVFAAAPPAEAGFWGDLKQSFGTAVDNAQREGAEAVDAVTGGAGDGASQAGDSGSAADPAAQPLDNPGEPVTDGSKQLSKQPGK
ncbi:MAG: hypothetical protein IIC03_07860 [Proteobacteria bacterium]|nr:hypothetical protein [Pseudomonadota bacterium]